MSIGRRILHMLMAVDQLLYVWGTLGAGYPDETLSSAAWRVECEGRIFGRIFRPVIDALFLILTLGHERAHCHSAYMSEVKRLQLPPSMRQADIT